MYAQLTSRDRVRIETLWKQKYSITEIAKILWKHKSTISRELRRNRIRWNIYNAKKAVIKAYQRNHRKKKQSKKIVMDNEMNDYIRKKLLDSWSPEIISAVIKIELWKRICWMSIRRYLETSYCYEIKATLVDKRFKKYYKRRNKIKKLWRLWDRLFIDKKPLNLDWEYEMDFVLSAEWDTTCMFNFVHKKSCMKMSVKLDNKSTELVDKTVKEIIEKMKIKCIVTDNDISFVHRKDWGVPVYFTHPYHSREKWLIERVNRRYRVFYPKKIKLKNVPQDDLDRVTTLLNRRPMKRLWYRTPEQVFNDYLLHC